ncbi:MAG: YdcH family protein [Bdellovibrionales bacterium]
MSQAYLKPSQDSRIQALRAKHASLSNSVQEAQKSPSIPDEIITLLKKRKLMVKQEIERICA